MVCMKWKDDDDECGWLMVEECNEKLEKFDYELNSWASMRPWNVYWFIKRKLNGLEWNEYNEV